MMVFIYIFIIWLISVILTILFIKSANEKEDENY